MEATRIQNKIKLLFEKISEPKYVMNSYYTDSFINKLSDASDPDASKLLATRLLPDLLIDAIKDTSNYHSSVNVFLGRILAIVCRNELHFCKILEDRRDKLKEFFINITSKNMNPSLKVAYLELAMSAVTHRTGVTWILGTDLWRQILSLYDKSTTVFVLRLMYKFSAEFLWKLNDFGDDNNLNAVVGFILQPVLELDFMSSVTLTIDEEQQLCEQFEPILQMLLSMVSQKDRLREENRVAHLLLKEKSIVTHLYILTDRVRREDTILLVSKLLFYLTLLKIFQVKPYVPELVYTLEDFMDLVVMYFNTMHFLIQRRNAMLVLDYCGNCTSIWRTVCQNVNLASKPHQGRKMELPNQMLLIYLVPILVYVTSTPIGGSSVSEEKILQYMSKFINMACEHTARAAYALRDLIMELDISSVTLQCVKRLTCIKGHLNDEQANIVFQSLYFALSEYDPLDEYCELKPTKETLEESEQKMLVMTYIVDTVLAIVKNYNINWHESLEVISLNTVIHNILMKRTNLSCKFTVAALNLLTVTVSKFLPPNLSLLLESRPGSAMHEIGALIFTKMHDVRWEVRDSALELLNVCTEISYIKFPPIQKQIIERNLISVAFTMALNEPEAYAQVSALRCVSAAGRVAPVWDRVHADRPDVTERLMEILRHNQEGIVRKEACNVLCELYQTGRVSAPQKQLLYDHMVASAMCDFHWEAQISALKFWRIVIQFLLMDQGMLDGTFPPVTFSKETRKIVTLNETEIRKRLLKCLDELASIGCLTVLLKLLHEDTEVEVMEAAYNIAVDLHEKLKKYKVTEYVRYIEGEPKNMAELVCYYRDSSKRNVTNVKPESSTSSDNVIEGILKSDDMSLLANIYQKGMNLQNEAPVPPQVKVMKRASPHLFVNFMESTDCKQIISQKRDWKYGIRSISSLLDDVLGMYEESNEEHNSLDCY